MNPPRAYHLRKARTLALLSDDAGAQAERQLASAVTPGATLNVLEEAMDAYRQGNANQAIGLCNVITPEDALAFWAEYLKALCHLRQKNWLAAKFGFDRCLDRQPDEPWLLMHRALARAELGEKEYAAAQKDFSRALAAAKDSAARALVLTNRSIMYIHQQQRDDADQALTNCGRAFAAADPFARAALLTIPGMQRGQRRHWDDIGAIYWR